MSRTRIIHCVICLTVMVLIAAVGCQTLHEAGVPGLEDYVKRDPEEVAREKSNREKFSVDRDHKALYWLLANKVSNGMLLAEVEEVLGTAGEETADFNGKGTEGLHQTTDVAYQWGPDTEGCSVVIFFRDGHVCNFNPKDYRNPSGYRS